MPDKNRKKFIIVLIATIAVYAVIRVLEGTEIINPYWQRVLDQALIMTMGALGLSIIYGFTGQFSLGHAAFFGLGAYSAGLFAKLYNSDHSMFLFIVSLLIGAAVAGLLALLIGLPILRLRSDYLGIATLGFGIIVKVGMDNSNKLISALGGATGMSGTPQIANFDWLFIFLILIVLFVRNFVYSSYGRACTAVREDEIAADVLGINTTKIKVMAFVLGCALAGMAGGMYAHRYPFLHPSSFDFLKSFDFLLVVVLGGLGSITGTVVTAIAWVFLLEVLRFVLGETFIDFRGVIYALILIVAIIMRPQGIFSGKEVGFLVPKPFDTLVGRKDGVNAGSGS
ncbi:MAG: ABC transporter [Peptococcaceae bacterium BICA1-7]|nr:MAG: ABC transporter [Peptococcaceae bacterium BICA1-7]HBV97616.1 branched-chain amino acid ABC transporter permease [Desulfotomaculum sp.]